MPRSDPRPAETGCALCAARDAVPSDDSVRIGPGLLAVGLLRAAGAVLSTAVAARFTADPRHLVPAAVRRG